jgi:hypothetical protein
LNILQRAFQIVHPAADVFHRIGGRGCGHGFLQVFGVYRKSGECIPKNA